MKPLDAFLARFKDLTPPQDAVKTAVANAIREVADIEVSKKQIQIAHGTAFIAVSSLAKSVIATSKAAVLTELYERLPKAREVVRDVR